MNDWITTILLIIGAGIFVYLSILGYTLWMVGLVIPAFVLYLGYKYVKPEQEGVE